MGGEAPSSYIQGDNGPLRIISDSGCFRIEDDCSASEIHVLVPRQDGSVQGCTSEPVGSGHLPVPSCSFAHQGLTEGEVRRDQGNTDLPLLALGDVVVSGGGHAGGASLSSATLSPSTGAGLGREGSLPSSSGGRPHFGDNFLRSLTSHDLNAADLEFLSCHLAKGTTSGYNSAFSEFKSFCAARGADPFTCLPAIVVKYLRHKFESGASYSTINVHRSAISKFHCGFDRQAIGTHALVKQAVKAAFRLRPPLPKYAATFDISPVLAYISSLEPLANLSLKMLTFKTFFLISFCTLCRVSSVARLGPDVQRGQV